MKVLERALNIHPGERRLAGLLTALMFFVSLGGAIGSSGVNALFFARFGAENLPYLYMALGPVQCVVLLGMAALLARLSPARVYTFLPAVLALVLAGERLVLLFGGNWLYPLLWLSMNLAFTLAAQFTWGLAGLLTDTRQAKRLFPLFGSGGIFGSMIGGLLTAPLARALHTENLLLVWAGALAVSFLISLLLPGDLSWRAGPRRRAVRRFRPGVLDEMRQGVRFIRGSQLLKWVLVSGVGFSILMYSLALPFSQAAAQRFPQEDVLAGFLGLFYGATTATALLFSLFLANRLFSRLGIMAGRLGLPVIYLLGFGALVFYPAFPVLVVFRLLELSWSQGISGAAYQAMFNVVPAQRREQVRTFINAVPDQAGTFLAGLLLAAGQQLLLPPHLYLIGLLAAAAVTLVLWVQMRAYRKALVQALHLGQPHLFETEASPTPFGGLQNDHAALSVVLASLTGPDPAGRRVAVEILAHTPAPKTQSGLVAALEAPDPGVRAGALKALACAGASTALLEVAARLQDGEPEVRLEAVAALRALAGPGPGLALSLEPLLADPDPAVRASSAAALLQPGSPVEAHQTALYLLHDMAQSPEPEARQQALKALGVCEWGEPLTYDLLTVGLQDPVPAVRRAAAASFLPFMNLPLSENGRPSPVEPLVLALGDRDAAVRGEAARVLGAAGPPVLERVIAALSDPALQSGALEALYYLPVGRAGAPILEFARQRAADALRYHRLRSGPPVNGRNGSSSQEEERLGLLDDALDDLARRNGALALRALGLLGDRSDMAAALENLESRYPAQRANAIETLESMGEQGLIRPLLSVWESGPVSQEVGEAHLVKLMEDPDPWVRACAALAAAGSQDKLILDIQARLAQSDPDPVVRETAAYVIHGGVPMHDFPNGLPTLPLIERVLFLRRVSLFADLAPADLRQLAAAVDERLYLDRDRMVQEGEPGEEMFIIVTGQVRVLETGPGGREVEVARRQPGDVVGEMALITREPRSASLETAGQVRTLCLDGKAFEGMLRERPEIGLAIMRELIARLRSGEASRLDPSASIEAHSGTDVHSQRDVNSGQEPV
jgi:HEAT repeat protein